MVISHDEDDVRLLSTKHRRYRNQREQGAEAYRQYHASCKILHVLSQPLKPNLRTIPTKAVPSFWCSLLLFLSMFKSGSAQPEHLRQPRLGDGVFFLVVGL